MQTLILKRLIGFGIDYVIIAGFAILLFGITLVLDLKELNLKPIEGQFLGFFSLTLPVFLYFFLSEKSRLRATVGKRIMNISVVPQFEGAKPRLLERNILKFLPWEIAHTGVHWIVFYSENDNDIPSWVWFLLIFPQIMMLVYLVSIIISKGKSSLYDRIANTRIKLIQHTQSI